MTTKSKTQNNLIPCGEAGCDESFIGMKERGKHRRFKHGIKGESASAKRRAILAQQRIPGAVPVLQCPHCSFVAKTPGGWALHLRKKHGETTQTPKPGKENKLAKRTTQTLVLTNGHTQENGQDHSNADGIPDSLIVLTTGRFQELCRSVAYEHGVPAKLFTARVAALVYATTVR